MEHLPKDIGFSYLYNLDKCHLLNCRLVCKTIKRLIEMFFNFVPTKCTNQIINLEIFEFVRKIDLSHCRLLTDRTLKSLKSVKCINLSSCSKITDKGIKYLSRESKINEINLSGCFQITDIGISYLSEVTFIDLSYCSQITNTGLKNFKNYPTLIVNDCPKISQSFLEMCSLEQKLFVVRTENDHEFLKPVVHKMKINKLQDTKNNYCEWSDKDIASKKITKLINKERFDLFDSIYALNSSDRDQRFMKNYLDLGPCSQFLDYDKAVKRLYQNNKIKIFIENLRLKQIDSLIGGSTALSCVYAAANFVPSDIDIYVKRLTKEKLLIIEDIIGQTFNSLNIVVVRTPITITWFVQLVDESITIIQVNLFNIEAWSEIFVTYHTDLTCIGYEILSGKFIYLLGRFDNILIDKPHYFSNCLNLDYPQNIEHACYKYKSRGFHCVSTTTSDWACGDWACGKYVKNLIPIFMQQYYQIELGTMSGSLNTVSQQTPFNCLPNILYEKYYDIDNIVFASTVDHIFGTESCPNILFLSVYKVHLLLEKLMIDSNEILAVRNFLNMPEKIKCTQGKYCHIYKEYYTVGIRCPICSIIISLKSYLRYSETDSLLWRKKISKQSICEHLHQSRNPNCFEYQWYPELFLI